MESKIEIPVQEEPGGKGSRTLAFISVSIGFPTLLSAGYILALMIRGRRHYLPPESLVFGIPLVAILGIVFGVLQLIRHRSGMALASIGIFCSLIGWLTIWYGTYLFALLNFD